MSPADRNRSAFLSTAFAVFFFSVSGLQAADKQPIKIGGEESQSAPRSIGNLRGNSSESLSDMLKVGGDSSGGALAPVVPPVTVVNPSRQPPREDKWAGLLNGPGTTEAEKEALLQAGFGVRNYSPDKLMGSRFEKEPARSGPSGGWSAALSLESRPAQDRSGDSLARTSLGSSRDSGTGAGSFSNARFDENHQDNKSPDRESTVAKDSSARGAFHADVQDSSKPGFSQGFANPFSAMGTGVKPPGGFDPGFSKGTGLDSMLGATVPLGQGFINNSTLLQVDPTRRELNPLTGSIRNELGGLSGSPTAAGAGFGPPAPMGAPAFGAAVDFLGASAGAPSRNPSLSSAPSASSAPALAPQPAVLSMPTRAFK